MKEACLGATLRRVIEASAGLEVADAQKVTGWRRWACKTDRIDAWVLARALAP